MADFVSIAFTGIALGSTYGIVALGITVVYSASKVVNFLQGELAMIAGMLAFLLMVQLALPTPLALLLLILVPLAYGLLVQHLMVEPLLRRNAPYTSTMLIVIGGSMVAQGVIGNTLGYGVVRVPPIAGFIPWQIGDVIVGKQYVAIVIGTIALTLAYWWFSKRTFIGTALRATGDNPLAASSIGIPASHMRTLAFAIGAVVAAISGYLAAPVVSPSVFLGFPLLLKGFVAAIVGGLGHPYAGVVGGMLLGLVLSFVAAYVSAAWSEVAMFLALIAALVWRPHGLFVRRGG